MLHVEEERGSVKEGVARGGQGWREWRQKKGMVERNGGSGGVVGVDGVEKCIDGHGLGGWSWEGPGWHGRREEKYGEGIGG